MELLIIIILILLNGIFAMSEMALVSSKKFKLEQAANKGKAGAKAALDLSENPNRFLSTVQIGITLIGILVGIFSGDSITATVSEWIANIDVLKPYAPQIGSVIVVIIVTFFSIVLGELLPKRLGMTFPETIASALAQPMNILSKITAPFVWALTKTNDVLLAILGLNKVTDDEVTEEEVKSIVRVSAEGGYISDIEQDIVERVFELGDTKVDHIFTYRNDITYFVLGEHWDSIKTKIFSDKHSSYPVCSEDDIDTVVGIVLLKDLFHPDFSRGFDISTVMREPLFVNEHALAYTVLEQFKKAKTHYGIVLDEYGNVQGLVTMDDVLGGLVGSVTDNNADEYEIVERDDNSWLIDGQYSLILFLKYFELNIDPEIKEEYNTVAGLVLSQLNDLPKVGTKVFIEDYILEVIDKDGQRIDKILMSKKNA